MGRAQWLHKIISLAVLSIFLSIPCALRAQGLDDLTPQLPVSDPICSYFKSSMVPGNGPQSTSGTAAVLAQMTARVTAALPRSQASTLSPPLPPPPGGTRTGGATNSDQLGLIDKYIFSAIQDAGAQPAANTTDWEFIRRVTLDLTGRIPDPNRVLQFIADTNAQ